MRISLLVCALWLVTSPVFAKHATVVYQSYDQAWNGAIRLIRVDYQFTIRDRDKEAGYLLFNYREGRKEYPASLEMLNVQEKNRAGVRIVVQIPQMPGYIEKMLLDKLKRKLKQDYGEPPPPPPPKQEAPKEDAPKKDAPEDKAPKR